MKTFVEDPGIQLTIDIGATENHRYTPPLLQCLFLDQACQRSGARTLGRVVGGFMAQAHGAGNIPV